jgi:hypothetical protein
MREVVSYARAGVRLNCGIGVAVEMAGRRFPQEACRLTQGSLAWASIPGAGEPLSAKRDPGYEVAHDRRPHRTNGSENHDGSSSSRTFIRRTLVCGLWSLGYVCGELLIFDTNQQFSTHRIRFRPGDFAPAVFRSFNAGFPFRIST